MLGSHGGNGKPSMACVGGWGLQAARADLGEGRVLKGVLERGGLEWANPTPGNDLQGAGQVVVGRRVRPTCRSNPWV